MYTEEHDRVPNLLAHCSDGQMVVLPYHWLSRIVLDSNKTTMTLLFGHTMLIVDGEAMEKLITIISEQRVSVLRKTETDLEKVTQISYKPIE